MARGTINKVILIGRLGDNPQTRYTPSGDAVVNFSLATNEVWKDDEGNAQERTEWHRVVVWRKLAEICTQYLKKGSHVYIEGRLQTRTWEDKDGNKKYTTEIVANRLQILDAKGVGADSTETEATHPAPGTKQAKGKEENSDEVPF